MQSPNIENQPSIQLPPVETEGSLPAPEDPVKRAGSEKNPEFSMQATPGGQLPSPIVQNSDDDDNSPQGGQQSVKVSAKQQHQDLTSGMPQLADDADLIEKEWVEKAKDIVSQTTGNPHKRSDELSRMKHEYIKRRFQREIKVKDSGA